MSIKYHFECPVCEYDDKEAGSLADETQIYCGMCAADNGKDVLLKRWSQAMTQRLTQRQISQLRSFDKNRRLWAKVDPKIADPDLRFFLDNNLVEWNRDEIGGYTLTDRGRIVLQNAAQQKAPKP